MKLHVLKTIPSSSSLERARLISSPEVHRCLLDIFNKCAACNALEEPGDPFALVAHFASPLLALDLLTWLATMHLHSALHPYACAPCTLEALHALQALARLRSDW